MNNKTLKLNQEVTLQGISYKVIGIDTYKLKSILDEEKEWISYTLIDPEGNKVWISYGVAGEYFTQWSLVSKEEFTKLATGSLNYNFTGIATVKFEGNPGYSTPTAEITWFNIQDQQYDFIASERFLKQNGELIEPLETYYDAGKILKDFKI
jgi:hypothetical protein